VNPGDSRWVPLCCLLSNALCSLLFAVVFWVEFAAGLSFFQTDVVFCASPLDQRGKGLYAPCSKLCMSLAHWRRCANYMFLLMKAGDCLEPFPVPHPYRY
jgi:hypothetical protein